MKAPALTLAVSATLLLGFVSPTNANTILIKDDGTGDQPTIQAGITAASMSDTVLLADGMFTGAGNREIDFMGKAITVISQNGKGMTTIDCEFMVRGFLFQNSEGASSILSGVTIINGRAPGGMGGAVYVDAASPFITRSNFEDCQADNGGGIACINGASPQITSCDFNNCGAMITFQEPGGGMYISNSSPTINSCNFNSCFGETGGGIYTAGANANPTIINNLFNGNSAFQEGAAIRTLAGAPMIFNNVFRVNNAGLAGGAMFIDGTPNAQIANNTIAENQGQFPGVFFRGSDAMFWNNILIWNTGEAMFCQASNPTVTCNVLFGNFGASGNDICGTDGGDNQVVYPEFCGAQGSFDYRLMTTSPCAPANSACGTLIGAFNIDCTGSVPAESSTWGRIKNQYR